MSQFRKPPLTLTIQNARIDAAIRQLAGTPTFSGAPKLRKALGDVLHSVSTQLQILNFENSQVARKAILRYAKKLNQERAWKIVRVPQAIGLRILREIPICDSPQKIDAYIELLYKASCYRTHKMIRSQHLEWLEELSESDISLIHSARKKLVQIPPDSSYQRLLRSAATLVQMGFLEEAGNAHFQLTEKGIEWFEITNPERA